MSNGIARLGKEKAIVHYKDGSTSDIIRVVMRVVNKSELAKQVAEFSEGFGSDDAREQYALLKELWRFVRYKITYKRDPEGIQDIQHPARLWARGYGDCKSKTVFIYFVLKNLGIPVKIRFASYTADLNITHVYPIAILNGKEVVMDSTIDRFDYEATGATKITDKYPCQQAKAITGVGKRTNNNALMVLLIGAIIIKKLIL